MIRLMKLGVLLFALTVSADASLINSFLSGVKSFWPPTNDVSAENGPRKLPNVQFELPTESEEFLKEALLLLDAPREALDLCTHRVVQSLKKNCNQLSMEEVGKLAVMMLNCQLENEGRPMFACKPEMTLKQCTIGMDAQMHQIYSYMKHRVVGMCSALKQDQFKAVVEMTVNNLMQVTQSQIASIHEGLKNQRRLNEMGIDNMNEFRESDGKIKEAQVQSLEKLKFAESLIDENLQSLQQELELRMKSEEKLVEIEKISDKLHQHTSDLHEEHEKLLKDVDEISTNLEKNNLQLLEQYHQALDFLNKFHSVMLAMSNMATKFKSYMDKMLEIIHEIGLELTDEFIAFMFLTFLYFTCAMVFMIFIDAEKICKIILIGSIAINILVVYSEVDIPLFALNILLWIFYFAYKLEGVAIIYIKQIQFKFTWPKFLTIKRQLKKQKRQQNDSESSEDDEEIAALRQRSITPLVQLPKKQQENRQMWKPNSTITSTPATRAHVSAMSAEDSEMSEIFFSQQNISLPITTASRPSTPMSQARPLTPAMRRVMSESLPQPDRTGTPFQAGMAGRVQCQGKTLKGLQCKNAAVVDTNFCRIHK